MKKIIFYIILIALMSCKIQQFPITQKEWRLVELNGQDVSAMNPPITLLLDETQMKVSGFAGCNQFFGSYQLGESNLSFSDLGSTKMYCQDRSAMEDRYLKALGGVDRYLPKRNYFLAMGNQTLLKFKK